MGRLLQCAAFRKARHRLSSGVFKNTAWRPPPRIRVVGVDPGILQVHDERYAIAVFPSPAEGKYAEFGRRKEHQVKLPGLEELISRFPQKRGRPKAQTAETEAAGQPLGNRTTADHFNIVRDRQQEVFFEWSLDKSGVHRQNHRAPAEMRERRKHHADAVMVSGARGWEPGADDQHPFRRRCDDFAISHAVRAAATQVEARGIELQEITIGRSHALAGMIRLCPLT